MQKRRLSGALVAVVLSSLLAACGGSAASSTDDKPYVPPEASDTPTVDPDATLIPDGPLFLALQRWVPSPTSERQLNPCLRQPLVVLGADKTRFRSFHSSSTDARGQDLVAVFHDTYAARQAAYLLRRWQETCADRVDPASVTAEPPQSGGPGRGSAVWFTTFEKGTSDGYTRSATGLVQVGRVVGLVTIQDTATEVNPDAVKPVVLRMLQRGRSRLG